MWRVAPGGGVGEVDMMVFDLDPGEPADIMQCCIVAELVRALLAREGLICLPKTSGSKGLQLYAPLRPNRPWEEVHAMAHDFARELERAHPDEIVSNMRKDIRAGKILIDWSQNHGAKTTIAPYSLRARPQPSVSTPLTWEEVHLGTTRQGAAALRFLASDVLSRVGERGDLFAPLLAEKPTEHEPS
jgi:bifunctional non-homologous end joining protein LigD